MVETSLAALFILLLLLMFILMSLFLYLMVNKVQNNKMRARIEDLKEENRLAVFQYLQTGDKASIETDLTDEKIKALFELLNEYTNVLDGVEVKERIHTFTKEYLTTFVQRQLKQRRWSLRMNALYSIEDFQMNHLTPVLHELYQKKRVTSGEKAQILKLFAQFNEPMIIDYLEEVGTDISDFSLLTILLHLDDEKVDELVEGFSNVPKRLQYMLVDAIGEKQLTAYHSLLQKLVISQDTELRVRALKAYANSGIPIDAEVLGEFFDSEIWPIRMMAAKVTGVQRLDMYKEQLVDLLSDQEYVVRAEAAKAILRFKDGEEVLESVVDESTDIFAKDMAIEWLEKERGAYSY
ncbi:HEAT repeat domain-containing protein [Fredinandcohnia sp. 179-A 10B2 NHS]|uniref:HEAT repeat domain-containing protein n=1 Tax=Fredinandcohnia sp. 179-A 10B2 NHS TaxID=3235176 RepID=UPI0039A15250